MTISRRLSALRRACAALLLLSCGAPKRPTEPERKPPERGAETARIPAKTTRAAELVPTIGFGDRTLRTAYAVDLASRARGFMNRDSIADDEALLFVYRSPDERRFWMRDCRVALDILFLDDDGRVLEVFTAPPAPADLRDDDVPRYASPAPVRLVLEVRAGLSAEAGVAKGVRVRLPSNLDEQFGKADP